jgi:hypothetical protein
MNLVLAIVIFCLMGRVALGAKVKFLNFDSRKPIVKFLAGPSILMIIGLGCLIAGLFGVAPVLLFLKGHYVWSGVVLMAQLAMSAGTTFEYKGKNIKDVPVILRMVAGMLMFGIVGWGFFIIGTILASPIILIGMMF